MTTPESLHIVIVGGGHAAAQVITTLRMKKFADQGGKVTLITDEQDIPYQRPPLTKAYLKGELAVDRLPILRWSAYETLGVDVILGHRAEQVDRNNKTVTLSDGRVISYDKLVLATGGKARPLSCAGADGPHIFDIRTREDVDRMRDRFMHAEKIGVVGGGYIGLEAASVASELGKQVDLLEAEDRVLARVVAPEVSEFYTHMHQNHGVNIHTSAMVSEIQHQDDKLKLTTKDERQFDVDMIVVGIGLIPNTELAVAANLDTDEYGIVVDEYCRTSDADIFAVGDVTSFHHKHFRRRMRLESVQNAVDQAKVAALNMLGEEVIYDSLPWFWSDQFGIKLQIAGLSTGYDQIITRGDVSAEDCAFFYLKDGELIAADCAGRVSEFMGAKKLIAARARPTPEMLADQSRPFKEIVAELLK